MKKIKKILTLIIVCLFITTIGINVLADTTSSQSQIVEQGGSKEENGVFVSKTIEGTNIENYFDITLTVRTQTKIEEILKDQELAIVVVMDISNSMIENKVDGDSGDTRLEAAQKAGKQMIETFTANSKETDAERKIGYVAFNSDATEIFGLQECNTDEKATSLATEITTDTNKIIQDNLADKYGNPDSDGLYKYSFKRFTNIEAGLTMAYDMLGASDIENKYVIFISDGFPTTYIDDGYTGYNTYTPNATSSSEGNFYNDNLGVPCSYGVDYSDLGARKAEAIATTIKNSGMKIFSIGTGLSHQKTIQNYLDDHAGKVFSTVDTDTTDYAIGRVDDDTKSDFKAWLQNDIGSGYYYDTTNAEDLANAYNSIFEKIKEIKEEESRATWVANDPMNTIDSVKNIEFVGLYNNDNILVDELSKKENNDDDTASFSVESDTLSWDLKNSNYIENEIDNTTYYTYSVKYRVRLTNEKSEFDTSLIYNTNGTTILTYVIRENGQLSDNKYIDFPIPSVIGHLGELTFTKISKFNNDTLEGAEFKLIHADDCICHSERKYATINDFIEASDVNGTVTFTNIPSGHKYKLVEITPPENYILDETEYDVIVSYGDTIADGIPTNESGNKIIENDILKSNLNISKFVIGDNTSGKFKFNLKILYNGVPISGTYNYQKGQINDYLTFNNDGIIFELAHNELITIYNLPNGAVYTLTELEIDGYTPQYVINSGDKNLGATASGNLQLGEGNNIDFINVVGSILPDTGGIGKLILIIIGSLLLVVPVIYIGYTCFKRERKVS